MTTSSPRRPEHPIDPVFLARWSPRAFAPDTIGEDELLALFEAARWAPSSYNSQPARFVYGRRGTPAFAIYPRGRVRRRLRAVAEVQ